MSMKSQSGVRLATTAALLALSAATVAIAAPVHFDVQATSLALGPGYGDANGQLGMQVQLAGASIHRLADLNAGAAYSFEVGTLRLKDEQGNGARGLIDSSETDGLQVTALFSFNTPLGSSYSAVATGTAQPGPFSDAAVDLSIVWDPVLFNFGTGGQFRLTMNRLDFTANEQTLQQMATITLVSAPFSSSNNAVPEPGSLALAGVALAGLALARRRQR